MINSYFRLEPVLSDKSLEPGFAARIYDPLWTIGRQIALGEFAGDDAGHPVTVHHTGYGSSLESDSRGPLNVTAQDLLLHRLQAPNPSANDDEFRLATLLGAELVRSLAGATEIVEALRADHQLTGRDDSYTQLVAQRGVDGFAAMNTVEAALDAGDLAGFDITEHRDALLAWREFAMALRDTNRGSSPKWDRTAFTYAERWSTSQDGELVVNGISGDRFDWYSVDLTKPETVPDATEELVETPTRAEFRGMPAVRYWAFEAHETDLGRVDNHPADLARAAMLNYALLHGNDHFLLPIELDVGQMFTTTALKVRDTFGVNLQIAPAATRNSNRWSLFSHPIPGEDRATSTLNALWLAPVPGTVLRSEDLETVMLIRDEMANVAWAIEKTLETPRGDSQQLSARDAIERADDCRGKMIGLDYRIGLEPPDRWIPLVPVPAAVKPYVELIAGSLAGLPARPPALNTFVRTGEAGNAGDRVRSAAIPREGRQLRRVHLLARTPDGTTRVWSSRESAVGRGEGGSGVRFDEILVHEASPE